MRDFGIISPYIWLGETGKLLRGSPDAQVVAFYLMTCPNSNMIGLYHLGIPTMCHETGLSEDDTYKALQRVEEVEFAAYDPITETVFVYEMAKFQIGVEMKPRDNRIKGVEKMLLQMRKCPFLHTFLDRYAAPYNLDTSLFQGAYEGDVLQAPTKPGSGSGTGSGTGEGSGTGKIAALSSTEKPLRKSRAGRFSYPASFEPWWLAYPKEKRVGKKKTFDAWKAAGSRLVDANDWTSEKARDWLQSQVEAFADSPAGKRTRYVQESHRWLNHGRYDDNPSAWEDHDGDESGTVRCESSPGRPHERDYSGPDETGDQ